MLTPEVIADILVRYKQTRSPFKTATSVGVSVDEVFSVINSQQERVVTAEERYGGLGRPDIRKHTVARRSATLLGWDNDNPAIIKARADYEAGTHIMATGRDGGTLILYSIPRKGRPDPMPGYFLPEVA
jgi:hypothetical protein